MYSVTNGCKHYISFSNYNQTKAFGNSKVSLLSGVITDYTEIGLI